MRFGMRLDAELLERDDRLSLYGEGWVKVGRRLGAQGGTAALAPGSERHGHAS